MKTTTIAAALALIALGCAKTETAVPQSAAPTKAAAAAAAPAPAQAPAGNLLAGKVLETFNGGGYTYVRVATPAGEQWAAVRETKVSVGDDVSIAAEMTMENFKSNTLDRTFDRIAFGSMAGEGGAPPQAAAVTAPAAATQGGPAGKFPPQTTSAISGQASQHMKAPDANVKVEKAPGGHTVAELWAGKKALGGKEVVVHGKVVKFLGGIMGMNWMHLQDGSGSAEKGDNDITVTTKEVARAGDVVTVKGTLTVDKDFGAGYRYEVIIEKASVTK